MANTIGVLALQGDVDLHCQALQAFNIKAPLIYKPAQLAGLDGLIIPGGESSALLKLMTPFNWQAAISEFAHQGNFIFGTCAGMILLASSVYPTQESLNLIDISVERNAYGRQLESHVAIGDCDVRLGVDSCEMVFIRAPKITRVGGAVTVLASCDDVPVLVQQDNIICAAFHPEMSSDKVIYHYLTGLMNVESRLK